jgi:hypothetical protein
MNSFKATANKITPKIFLMILMPFLPIVKNWSKTNHFSKANKHFLVKKFN